MEEGQAQVAEEWDKHEFFDDLEWTTLDSLGKVIEIADSIVAYNWNGHNGNPASVHHHIVDAYGKFDEKVGNNIALNDFQKTTLKGLLIDSTNFEGNNSTCFIPHIAFVYYKESEIIGQSNVCFLCSGVKSVPKSTKALSSMGIRKLKDFCRKIGLEILDDASQLSR
ncbi:MAG: hypothetical protein AAGI38_05300 [Bacteroidota bacterium]